VRGGEQRAEEHDGDVEARDHRPFLAADSPSLEEIPRSPADDSRRAPSGRGRWRSTLVTRRPRTSRTCHTRSPCRTRSPARGLLPSIALTNPPTVSETYVISQMT